ncbi:MAG: peptidoglycan DD-metalloendopeptidase family protein [Nocardioidaceae bacterium]
MTRRRTGLFALAMTAALAGLVVGGLPSMAATSTKPRFQMPFACGERWEGSTRASHSPSPLSVDWNRDGNDVGHIVVATAPGTVTSVVDLGDSSYGLYVVIDHGNGWSTLHAHLLKAFVVVGERVDQGQTIALLGNSGGSTGPHLHYEQRYNRNDQHAYFNDKRFAYNSWLTSRSCADVPIVGDWNGDHLTDVGVFGRQRTAAVFRQRLPSGTSDITTFGLPTDQPIVGDWNGDGQSDPGAYGPSTATFTLQTGNGGRQTFAFGMRGDLPVAGDWNGDGRFDVGVFRPSKATFFLRLSGGSFSSRVFGSASSLPVAGDWDGDGRWEVGVYDPGTARFGLAKADGTSRTLKYGTATSTPVIGDWNGDSISDLGVWDRTTGVFSKRFGPKRTTTIRYGHRR